MAEAGHESLTNGEKITRFLESSGFAADRVVEAHELLARLAARGLFPKEFEDLKPFLAPVLCSSEADRAHFHEAFAAFVRGEVQEKPKPDNNQIWVKSRSYGLLPAAAVALALVVVAFVVSVCVARLSVPDRSAPSVFSPVPEDIPPYVPPPPLPHRTITGQLSGDQNRPVANAVIYYRHTSVRSGTDGRFQFSVDDVKPFPLLIAHQRYSARLVEITPQTRFIDEHLTLKPGEVDPPGVIATAIELETLPPWWASKYAAMALIALLGALLVLAIYLRSQWLKRWSVSDEPELRPFEIREASGVFSASAVRRAARLLRRPVSISARVLAVEPTVRSTAAQAGYFREILLERTEIPDYVVLIERFSDNDQAADLRSELFSQFAAHQVRVRRFEFHEDPRYALGPDGQAVSLDQLAKRYPTSVLFVFCELAHLRDPGAMRPAPWISSLERWKHVVVFAPYEEYGYTAREVQDILGPRAEIRSPGLDGLREWAGDTAGASDSELAGEYPAMVREFPKVWLERHPPPSREISQLLVELRRFLGPEGSNCLAACAIYPCVSFPLTCRLVAGLVPKGELGTFIMERLTMLPWFRFGSIPDWLRSRLIASLPRHDERTVRKHIRKYLTELRAQKQVQADGPRSRYERVSSSRPVPGVDGELRDHIFLSFMLGWKPSRLAVRPPGGLLLALLAWRPVLIAAVAAGVFGLAGWTVATRFSVPEKISVAPRVAAGTDSTPRIPSGSEFLDRVLDIAASQVGLTQTTGQWKPPFLTWCFDQARMIAAGPALDLPQVSTDLDIVYHDRTVNPAALHAVVFVPSGIKPGFLYADGSGVRIVESSDGEGHLTTVDSARVAPGSNTPVVIREALNIPRLNAGAAFPFYIIDTRALLSAAPPLPDPMFNEPVVTRDETAFKVPHTSDDVAYKLLDARAAQLRPLPAPVSRGGVEPTLTLGQTLGTKGPVAISAIEKAGQIVFHAVGSTGATESPRDQASVADRMISDYNPSSGGPKPSFFFHLGDVIYSFGESKYYYDQFYEPYRNYPAPILALAGNHDGLVAPVGTIDTTLKAFLDNFCADGFRHRPEAGGLVRTTQIQPGVYFTFEAPMVRIFALYSNVLDNPGGEYTALGDDQLQFLDAALTRVRNEKFNGALIVAVHHDSYAAGMQHPASPQMNAQLDGIFQKTGVWPHVILSGHSHNYQRFTRTVSSMQIPYVVAGNGGESVTRLSPRAVAIRTPVRMSFDNELVLETYDDQDFGYLRVRVNSKQLRIEYVPALGQSSQSLDDVVIVDLATHTLASSKPRTR